MPKLYTYFRSSAAFRVRIALNLKGVDYDPEFVHLARGEHRLPGYRALNAQALVPALQDADNLLTQSLAIIEYLEEKHPGIPLLPKDLPGRARVRSLSQLIACEIHPLNNLRVLQYLVKVLGHSEDEKNQWYRHWVADGLLRLESDLVRSADTGRFCHGDSPTIADCCVVPQVFNAMRFECDLAPYPRTRGIFDECMKLEAFQKAQPTRQPDAE